MIDCFDMFSSPSLPLFPPPSPAPIFFFPQTPENQIFCSRDFRKQYMGQAKITVHSVLPQKKLIKTVQ